MAAGLARRDPLDIRIIRIAVILGSTLAGLLVGEGAVRLFAPRALLVPFQDELDGIIALRPNVRGRNAVPGVFDVTISTNPQRFRGPKNYDPEPAPGVIRIATLGDSFTLGGGANDNEAYPAQLERFLQKRLGKGPAPISVEVINAGTSGTGTGEQALWYARWVRQFHPRLVVLAVVPNDVDEDHARNLFTLDAAGRASPRPAPHIRAAARPERLVRRFVNAVPGYQTLAQHSQLLSLVRITSSDLIARFRKLQDGVDSPEESKYDEWFRTEGLQMLRAEVLWLRERTSESRAKLAVVFVPFPEALDSANSPGSEESRRKAQAITEALRQVCGSNRIPFADVTPLLREQAAKTGGALYYKQPDFHPNAEGYRVIAETVAELILKEGLLEIPVF